MSEQGYSTINTGNSGAQKEAPPQNWVEVQRIPPVKTPPPPPTEKPLQK